MSMRGPQKIILRCQKLTTQRQKSFELDTNASQACLHNFQIGIFS